MFVYCDESPCEIVTNLSTYFRICIRKSSREIELLVFWRIDAKTCLNLALYVISRKIWNIKKMVSITTWCALLSRDYRIRYQDAVCHSGPVSDIKNQAIQYRTSRNCHYFAGLKGEHPISDAFTDPMAFICCVALNGIWKQGLSESPSTKILRREAMFLLRILPQFFCSSFCGVGSLRKKARQKGSNFVARNICTKLDLLRCRFDL